MPPLWSFGLWMSRITYFSEQDGRQVAAKLETNAIPTDVLHLIQVGLRLIGGVIMNFHLPDFLMLRE